MDNKVKFYSDLLKKQEDFAARFDSGQGEPASSLQALEFYIRLDIEPHRYDILSETVPGVFLPYASIEAMLESCGPPVEFIDETRSKMRVDLQALMQNTAERIIEMNSAEIVDYVDGSGSDPANMKLLCKWSMDCTPEHERFVLKSDCKLYDGKAILSATVTPIRMVLGEERTIWHNAMPQSLRFSRPIVLQYVKEKVETILDIKRSIEKDIANLKQIRVILPNGKMTRVNFDLALSLTEENASKYIPDILVQGCTICGSSPEEMSSVERFDEGFQPKEKPPYYSITPLYNWLWFFDYLLDISCRLDIQQWKIPESSKEEYQQKKERLIKQLYEKFDDLEDPGCSPGEICQRAFAKPTKLSSILGINEELITRFHTILVATNVRDPINPAKLDSYCKETYRHLLNLYGWSRVPVAVHQVLAHGAESSFYAPAPLATLAEEAAEPRRIILKKRQTHHAHERERRNSLKEVFMRALYGSDPLVGSCWLRKRRDFRFGFGYPDEVNDFLMFEENASASDIEEEINLDDEDRTPMEQLQYDVGAIGIEFRKVDE